jgi:aminomethyltransferase
MSKALMTDLLGPSIGDLKYYHWTKAAIGGAEVVITRTGWTSEVGYEVYLLDPGKGNAVFESIMQAGEKYGLVPTGPSDIRRIEGAIFNWGADMTYNNNAFEMGLERLVDFGLDDESCISIAAYRRIRDEGVKAKINGVIFDGPPFPELNNTKWVASIDGQDVGKVTSAIFSPRLDRNIGYCWLPTENSILGQKVEVETEWGRRSAEVAAMPFVDPEKRIPVS